MPYYWGLPILALILLLWNRIPLQVWYVGMAIVTAIFAWSTYMGGFHAGVEYDWWEGITACAQTASGGGGSALDAIINTPLIRCDRAPWDLLGISLAGWNFLISVAGGLTILWLLRERKR